MPTLSSLLMHKALSEKLNNLDRTEISNSISNHQNDNQDPRISTPKKEE